MVEKRPNIDVMTMLANDDVVGMRQVFGVMSEDEDGPQRPNNNT